MTGDTREVLIDLILAEVDYGDRNQTVEDIADRILAAGFTLPGEGTQPGCTGDSDCPAPAHLHGCFSDDGKCSEPGEHSQGMLDEIQSQVWEWFNRHDAPWSPSDDTVLDLAMSIRRVITTPRTVSMDIDENRTAAMERWSEGVTLLDAPTLSESFSSGFSAGIDYALSASPRATHTVMKVADLALALAKADDRHIQATTGVTGDLAREYMDRARRIIRYLPIVTLSEGGAS